MAFIIIRRMTVGKLRRYGRSRVRCCTGWKPDRLNGLWRKPAIFCGMSRWLMHRIRLGIAVCIRKWMTIDVRVGSWSRGAGRMSGSCMFFSHCERQDYWHFFNRSGSKASETSKTQSGSNHQRQGANFLLILVASIAAVNPGALSRKDSVWLSDVGSHSGEAGWPNQGREEFTEANWLHASVVAPTVVVTPPHLRYLPRGSLVFCSRPPFSRGSLHGCGWYPGTSVVFSAAEYSSVRRHGAGQKNGGGVGTSCRRMGRKKGRKKGKLFGGEGDLKGRL